MRDYQLIKYSFIIPCYNVSKYILTAIESIPVREDIEIIIIDDGSTDGLSNVISSYKGNKIIYFHKENGGVSSARNKGIDLATGKYLLFFDGDDYYSEDLINYLDKGFDNAQAKMITFGYNHLANNRLKYYSPGTTGIKSTRVLIGQILLRQSFQCMCSFAVESDLVKNNNLRFNEVTYYYEDIEFQLKVMSLMNFVFVIDKPLFFYISRKKSATNSFVNEKHFSLFYAIDRLENILDADMNDSLTYFRWYSLFWIFRLAFKNGCTKKSISILKTLKLSNFKYNLIPCSQGRFKYNLIWLFQKFPIPFISFILNLRAIRNN
ncbi:TPA: glycosyltransferase [Escherichia coli]|uniref:glycosyltransferase family 2 protein n=6 Tax=Escherichia coli TaxID=562 RepID=UPI0001F90AF4|nr:glycosyltransferase family 2 protein [Escherichia coli]EKK2897767.1 glycosyltransferase family 2 protein [Escherichia coli O96]EKK3632181.1 glycosyltransferase family 2 protein [Escherichia coli O20]EAC0482377.1 glycosyltransferase family 2 protein [Escherichia coli]EER8212872.1 glycosyltransferase [Escherichia coli]EES4612408.1 glycosyltransferase [Escherichia coli]